LSLPAAALPTVLVLPMVLLLLFCSVVDAAAASGAGDLLSKPRPAKHQPETHIDAKLASFNGE
jgi:hypothetical protein